jgi:hypothetical protein
MRFVLLLCCAALAGCAQIPAAEFTAYTQAFEQARPAAEAVLADYSAAKEELARLEQANAPAPAAEATLPYPASYEPPSNGTEALDDVAVRFLALQAITDYNAALGQLVEGGSVAAANQSIDGFAAAVGQLAALGGIALPAPVGPAVAALQTVAAEIEKARLAREFQEAVRDGAPVVAQMIDILKADTVDHCRLRFALANRELILLETGDDGSPVVATAIADNKAKMEKLRGVLDNYNALLDVTRAALLELSQETARPADLDAIVARVIPVVIQLKRDLEAYRTI